MPELPEVRNIAEILDKEYTGMTLVTIVLHQRKNLQRFKGFKYFFDDYPINLTDGQIKDIMMLSKEKVGKVTIQKDIDYDFLKDKFDINEEEDEDYEFPVNSKVLDIKYSGKRIFFDLKDGLTIASFLGMTGLWHINDPGDKHKKATFTFKDKNGENKNLYFTDIRNFGTINVIKTEKEMKDYMKTTGPDYFDKSVTLEYFLKVLTLKTLQNKTVLYFFHDQQHISGIGNYLAVEILNRAEISPYRLIKNIKKNEREKLYYDILEVMNESYESGGYSIIDYINPYGKKGNFQAKVYGKKNVEGILYEQIDGRGFYWMPSIQH